MPIFDISLPISSTMITWPGDPPVEVERRKKLEEGATSNVSQLRLGTHTGTHVDPPFHFLQNGRTVEDLSLEVLMGPALVVHLPAVQAISAAHLEEALEGRRPERLLLCTDNSQRWAEAREFNREYVAPDDSAARWLVERGVRLVGVDYLSVERFRPKEYVVHRTLLEAGVIVVEGLDLSAVEAGDYQLICLPLKIAGGDGAPARAVLIQ